MLGSGWVQVGVVWAVCDDPMFRFVAVDQAARQNLDLDCLRQSIGSAAFDFPKKDSPIGSEIAKKYWLLSDASSLHKFLNFAYTEKDNLPSESRSRALRAFIEKERI